MPLPAALSCHAGHRRCRGTEEGPAKGASVQTGLQGKMPNEAARKSLPTPGRGEETSQGCGVMVCFDVRCCQHRRSIRVAVCAHFRVMLTGVCLSNVNLIQI